MSAKPTTKGLVYFMRRSDGVGPVKIGCSQWPEKRLAMFQIWSPEPLEIVATANGTFNDERRLHRQFEQFRLHSEWFEAAPPVLAMLARVAATGALPPAPASDRTLQIIARFKSNETLQAIADDYGVSRQRVEQILRKAGVEKRGQRGGRRRAPIWSKIEEARSLAASGCSCEEIADAVGDTKQNVFVVCRKEGIQIQRAVRKNSPHVVSAAFDIAADYKAGMNTREIAEKYGKQQPSIYHFLRIAGVKPNRVERSVYDLPISDVIAAYKMGATVAQLAERHGRAPQTITAHIRKAGVLRTRAENEVIRIKAVRAANARRAA